jgi:hypothetical protein
MGGGSASAAILDRNDDDVAAPYSGGALGLTGTARRVSARLGFGAPLSSPFGPGATNNWSAAPATPIVTTSSRTFGNATVKFPFKGQEADELSVGSGERIEVVQQLDREWAQCRNERGQHGIVPLNVLKRDAR